MSKNKAAPVKREPANTAGEVTSQIAPQGETQAVEIALEGKNLKLADASLGLSMMDPISGAIITQHPNLISETSEWLDLQILRGTIVEV